MARYNRAEDGGAIVFNTYQVSWLLSRLLTC
jgi:hypothetical protein